MLLRHMRVPLFNHKDAFALLLAAHHPPLKLLGVSTVHGNASVAHTTANAGSILTALGVPHIPYYAGAARPFSREAVYAPDIHGASGLDGTDLLPTALVPPVKNANAIMSMHEAIVAQPAGNVWLVATGALTNVALLFATFPKITGHLKGLSIMGGAIGDGFTDAPMGRVQDEGERIGNTTPWAEFNILCDPEAAQSIFSNPALAAKTTLIPLDLTHQVLATEAVRKKLLHGSSNPILEESSSVRQMFHDLLLFFAHTYSNVFGISEGPPLHDPVAVAVILADTGVNQITFDDRDGERWSVSVVTDGSHTNPGSKRSQVGRTVISPASDQGVRIPRAIDVVRFWDVLEECLQSADKLLSANR
ncbi:MAG: hypothetical protein Q9220_001976 [cf. Caloplaca sp. 1 TL-2023]